MKIRTTKQRDRDSKFIKEYLLSKGHKEVTPENSPKGDVEMNPDGWRRTMISEAMWSAMEWARIEMEDEQTKEKSINRKQILLAGLTFPIYIIFIVSEFFFWIYCCVKQKTFNSDELIFLIGFSNYENCVITIVKSALETTKKELIKE